MVPGLAVLPPSVGAELDNGNLDFMWIRTANGIEWIEVKQTSQGFWITKSK